MGRFGPYPPVLLQACLPACLSYFTLAQVSRAGEGPQTNGYSCSCALSQLVRSDSAGHPSVCDGM